MTGATRCDSEMLDFAKNIVVAKDRQHIALLSEYILQKYFTNLKVLRFRQLRLKHFMQVKEYVKIMLTF